MAPAFECLDDEHAAAAARAWSRKQRRLARVSGFGVVRGCGGPWSIQRRARLGEIVGATAVSQEPIVANAMKAFRQNVHQKAADELVRGEGHELVSLGTLDPVVFVFERDGHPVRGDQAAVGDGDAMRVAREVRENGFGSAEGLFGIDHPFRSAERGEEGGEDVGVSECGVGSEESLD